LVAGPSHWAETDPTCDDNSQSPINIDQDKATHKDLGRFQLTGYDAATSAHTLENNGHTGISLRSSSTARAPYPYLAVIVAVDVVVVVVVVKFIVK